MPPFATPDVLVLAGGGVLGEAWMTGMLAGIEDATGTDLRRVEAFVGTSAGSIVAARPPRRRAPPAGAPGGARTPPPPSRGRRVPTSARTALRGAPPSAGRSAPSARPRG